MKQTISESQYYRDEAIRLSGSANLKKIRPKLTLVGAGPGDPELISIKAVKAIASADVLLYDALIHPKLLNHAAPSAKKIYVGKRSGNHTYTQEKINKLIVDHALDGAHVVRLKGGDPFIFGRGKEEIDYAQAFDIETAAILGISSINLPGLYGIPLTQRGTNESFWVVTSTTSSGTISNDVHLAAQSTATCVFLMGLGKLEQISKIFVSLDKGKVPAAIISKGSLKESAIILGSIGTLFEQQQKVQLPAPAIIVVGETVGTHQFFYDHIRALNSIAIT